MKKQITNSNSNSSRSLPLEKQRLIGVVFLLIFVVTASFNYLKINTSILYLTRGQSSDAGTTTPIQLSAIFRYATSRVVPQQSRAEIRVSFDVLKSNCLAEPCNFLVFGVGYDSLMWTAFNPRGTTLFLEDDSKWVQTVLRHSPSLRVRTVRYDTRLTHADDLLAYSKTERHCLPPNVRLRGNKRCKLALLNLRDEVYDTERDVIMIDAPKGYHPEAPGRMTAIYSAAVMARNRNRPGNTHVFLHDVNRKVEKMFAEEFLCKKYLVQAVGRLWHFEIPQEIEISSIQFWQQQFSSMAFLEFRIWHSLFIPEP